MSVRRIVTGHDRDGNSRVLIDGPAANVTRRAVGGTLSTVVWTTDATPAPVDDGSDGAAGRFAVQPPPRGTVFRIIEFPPGDDAQAVQPGSAAREFGIETGILPGRAPRHPMIHRTRSLDYIVVLSGEIDLLLDSGDIRLHAGDVVVQQGTNHAWINRGAAPCTLAIVFIDACEPAAIEALAGGRRQAAPEGGANRPGELP